MTASNSNPKFLFGMNAEEVNRLVHGLGFPRFRAVQLLDWTYSKNIQRWEEAKNLPKVFLEKVKSKAELKSLECSEVLDSGNGESKKFLFRTHDQRLLETVLISQQDRQTVCVSTQLGCKVGCVFCASGKGKFGRNLTAGEIVEQIAGVQKYLGKKITNVVYMGMGEPLDNFEETMKSLEILQAAWGFGLGARRITVSTSGITPKIVEFVKRQEGRVRLSVSLHSSQEKTRTELVPINKKYSLKELAKTLREVHLALKRDITFEYTLIQGVNDSKEEAEGVARLCIALQAKVNVIPYNPIREMDFQTPTEEQIANFQAVLERRGVRVTIRQTAGRDIHAACGQLRLDRENPGLAET